tara:strand:+ start:982 stop:1482 length:501 start_codon:yes stop_codon:yes gene_type:complete
MATVTSTKSAQTVSLNESGLLKRVQNIRYGDVVRAGAYATDDTATFVIPVKAGEIVDKVVVKLNTAFADSGTGDQLNVIVGDVTDPNGFIVSAALHTTQTEITYVYNTGAYLNDGTTDNTVNGKLYLADTDLLVVLDGSAGASIDLDLLTAGDVDIIVYGVDTNAV